MTSSAHTPARFWNRVADRYAARPVADEAAYQEKLRVTRTYLRPHMQVLELGCGTGSTALVHAPHVGHIRAVDVSQRMVEIARDKAQAAGVDNVRFERAAIDELDAEPGSYDVVLALSVLHLLPNKQPVIDRVHQMLAPGGIFVSSTPCLGSAKYVPLRLMLAIGRMVGRFPLVRYFSREQLRASLTSAGFAIDHEWQPGPGKDVFLVARKTGVPATC